MTTGMQHQPEGADDEEVAADALRDALRQCFEPVSGQSVPEDMLLILARAACRQPAAETA